MTTIRRRRTRLRTARAQNLTTAQNSLLTNYNTSTTGVTLSASSPLRHLFAHTGVTRVGISYALSRSSVTTFNDNTRNIFQTLAFRSGVAGLNQLNGIVSSVITPSFSFTSIDRPVGPHSGKDLNVALQIAGVAGRCEVPVAGGELPPVLPDEGAAGEPRRP